MRSAATGDTNLGSFKSPASICRNVSLDTVVEKHNERRDIAQLNVPSDADTITIPMTWLTNALQARKNDEQSDRASASTVSFDQWGVAPWIAGAGLERGLPSQHLVQQHAYPPPVRPKAGALPLDHLRSLHPQYLNDAFNAFLIECGPTDQDLTD